MKLTITDDATEANEKVVFVGVTIFARILDLLIKLDCLPRIAEQRDAPVHAEQNVASYCTGHVAPVVNGYCFECGLQRLPRSNRSAGG